MDKTEIFQRIKENLVEFFEIDEAKIVPHARLYEDLDIDSIDAIDLIVRMKHYTNKTMTPDMFKSVRTIDDIVEVLYTLVN